MDSQRIAKSGGVGVSVHVLAFSVTRPSGLSGAKTVGMRSANNSQHSLNTPLLEEASFGGCWRHVRHLGAAQMCSRKVKLGLAAVDNRY
jgi:hypothetical protein